MEIWKKASIPTVHHVTITNQIKREHDKLNNILKSYSQARKETASFKNKVATFKQNASHLFDIAYCKCKSFEECVCDISHKVPTLERPFLLDQRTTRIMAIGSLDRITTEKLNKKIARKTKQTIQKTSVELVKKLPHERPKEKSVHSSLEETIQPMPSTSQTRINLSTFARTCDRYGISDRPAAALASALMHDVNAHTEVSSTEGAIIIDRSKVRRERKKMRLDLKEMESAKDLIIQGLYFDGRKDKTMTMVRPDGVNIKRKIITEEHISIIYEPGSGYLGHVSPITGSAENIKTAICNFLTEANIDTSNILAIGCDGTVVNTGNIGGVICSLEKQFERHLHWIVCQLHSNELPLRHLIEKLDGTTSGPRGFSGAIGKNLTSCDQLPVINYKPIKCELPEVDREQLSTDQKYLFDVTTSVSTGEFPASLASKNPGKLSHARWLTTANRILRLYVSIPAPSENLVEIATFINKVYAPMWFNIKTKPTIKDAPLNLWRTIRLSRYLREDLREIIDKTIQRNAFFAHSESLLVAMLADERRHIRELAMRRILSIRTKESAAQGKIRKFEIPTINFLANDYIELIFWQEQAISEPTLTRHLTDEELKKEISENLPMLSLLFNLPCHTQAVERCVKVVSEASLSVCDSSARDGFIRSRLRDRNIMPVFETKRDYKAE